MRLALVAILSGTHHSFALNGLPLRPLPVAAARLQPAAIVMREPEYGWLERQWARYVLLRPVDGADSKMFRKYDVDSSGDLDLAEVRAALLELGLVMDSFDADRIINKYDANGDCRIDAHEFKALFNELLDERGVWEKRTPGTARTLLFVSLIVTIGLILTAPMREPAVMAWLVEVAALNRVGVTPDQMIEATGSAVPPMISPLTGKPLLDVEPAVRTAVKVIGR